MQASSAGILASALGHGAALAGLVWLGGGSLAPRAAKPGEEMTVVMLRPDPPAGPVQHPAVAERMAQPAAVARPAERPRPVAAPPREADAGAEPQPDGTAAALPSAPVSAGPSAPGEGQDGHEPVSAAPGASEAATAYAAALWSRIARHRPRGLGVSGTALVLVVVGPGGGLDDVRIDRSSGDPRLDARALEAVRAAAPFPPPPAEMDGAARRFLIPFAYR